jgi:hypothetical protein
MSQSASNLPAAEESRVQAFMKHLRDHRLDGDKAYIERLELAVLDRMRANVGLANENAWLRRERPQV